LSGDATEASGGNFDLDFVAELGVSLNTASIEDGDLVVFRGDALGNDEFREGPDVTGLRLYGNAQLAGRSDSLLSCGNQRLLYSGSEDITADALFLFPVLQDGQKIGVHNSALKTSAQPALSKRQTPLGEQKSR